MAMAIAAPFNLTQPNLSSELDGELRDFVHDNAPPTAHPAYLQSTKKNTP